MRGSDDFDRGRISAMSGGKSPWGEAPGAAEADPPTPADDGPEANSDGPSRNPWLAPNEPDQARRSASIDHIFRQRGGDGPPRAPFTRGWLSLAMAGLVAAWIGGTSIHILGKGEQGLVSTFTKFDRTVGSGTVFTLPWPIQSVDVRNTARIEETILPAKEGENLMLTRDRQLADIGFKLRWRITDLRRFAFASSDSAAQIERLADAEIHAAVAEQRFDDLIDGTGRNEMLHRIAARTQAALDTWKLGVKVESAELTRVGQPAQLSEAFRKVGIAREEARKRKEDAQKFSQDTLKTAASEAAAFEAIYAQYKVSPKVTRQRFYYETMERVLAGNNKVVVGGSGITANVSPPASTALPSEARQPATPTEGQ